jgi:uncharacterized LabA/DUF88 family protein
MASLRAAMFFDGSNFYYAYHNILQTSVDFIHLKGMFEEQYQVVACNYYTAVPEDSNEYNRLQRTWDFMAYNGYVLKTKPLKVYENATGTRRKGNVDVEIATDAIDMSNRFDVFILFSGDGDFKYLVERLQSKGIHVIVVSTLKGSITADDLRRQANQFLDLSDLLGQIEKRKRNPLANALEGVDRKVG